MNKENSYLKRFLELQRSTIKYQAWHTKMNRIIPAEELAKDQLTLLADGRLINVHHIDPKLSEIYDPDQFIPLLWTGLRDIIGSEVYAGDIVIPYARVGRGYNERPPAVVWYDPEMANWSPYELHVTERLEKIGNIFENPELLEPK